MGSANLRVTIRESTRATYCFSTVAMLSSSGRIPRSISTRDRAITNDWRISMTRAIVGIARLVVAFNDRRTINRDGQRPMVRSIDRCLLRPIVRAIVASCDRSYEHPWHPVTERTINRVTRRPIVRSIWGCDDRSRDQS